MWFLCLLFAHLPTPYAHVDACMAVKDQERAVMCAKELLDTYQKTSASYETGLKVYSKLGQDKELIQLWKNYCEHFPEKAMQQEVLETLGWGVLRKGINASQATNQMLALIGATITQDRFAVPFILTSLKSSSIALRSLAVQLAVVMRDHELQRELGRLFSVEKNPHVRCQMIEAIGQLGMESHLPHLFSIVESSKKRDSEKNAAIQAIVTIKEKFTRSELDYLSSHPKAQMRLIAAKALEREVTPSYHQFLLRLLQDTNPSVLSQALHCCALLGLDSIGEVSLKEKIFPMAESQDPSIAIAACFWLLSVDSPVGNQKMKPWLEHKQPSVARISAAAVAGAGKKGLPLMKEGFHRAKDPYVKLNLALGLIGQREDLEEAIIFVGEVMRECSEKWMRSERSLFHPICPSTLTHRPDIPYYPEIVNQTVRLELTRLLALLDAPVAADLLKELLKERQRGVMSLIGQLLLGVGDTRAIEHVYAFLEDSDAKVRLEAALLLSSMVKDESALPILMEAFDTQSREGKIQIMEAIGRLGERSALPFLIKQLESPSLNMRLVAASMLIFTLKQ